MSFLRSPYKVAFTVALLFIAGAFTYRIFFMSGPASPTPIRAVPTLGEAGSDHRHATLAIMIGDRVVDFCDPKYMLKSPLVHFEDNNCYVVHKHARGITLATFFKTIGVQVTDKCLTIPGEEKRCNDGTNHLRVMWNGTEVPPTDLPYLELNDDDRILVNFGGEEGVTLRLKWNQIPAVPEFIRKTSMGRTSAGSDDSPKTEQ